MTVFLAGEDVGDVDLDLWCRNGEESIAKGHGGVAVTTKVDDETIGSETHLMDAVDKLTFYITLVITNFHIREHLAETVNNLFHGGGAIDLGLATAGKVKVWTINDSYFSGEYPAVVEKTVEEIGCPVDIENDSNDNQCIAKP